MNTTVIIFLVAALIVGVGVLIIVALTKRTGSVLNTAKYQTQWLAIEQSLKSDQPATAELAVIKADKLLDQALRERGFSGKTMGERMKSANSNWSNANHVWTVHKLRNQIAHEENVTVSYDNAKRSLGAYRQALKDLGAI